MKTSRLRPIVFLSAALAALAILALPALSPAVRTSGVAAPAEAADPVRLMETVRALSTYPDGSPRTRFAYHPDMDSIGVWIEDQLKAALAPAGVRASTERWPFPSEPETCKTCPGCPTWDPSRPYLTTLKNIIGHLQGQSPGEAKFLITAHYDAIACATPGWQPEDGVAPGADDNATGVAAVIELARLLSQDAPYEFDIEFVLFDGEEEVLLGSKALAEAYRNRGDNILGVFNMDMIGYNPRVDSLVVMTNRSSDYLARFMEQTEALDPQPAFYFSREVNNRDFSDHSPFWVRSYPAVLLIENVRIEYPHYHRVTDVPASIPRQGIMMAKGTNVILKTIRRLGTGAAGPPHLVLDNDFVVSVNRGPQPPAYAGVGDTVRVLIGAFNTGGNFGAGDQQTIRLYRVTDAGREFMTQKVVEAPLMNGERTLLDYTFYPSADDAGAITLEAETGEGADRSVARHAVPVRVSAVSIVKDYIAPNPVRDPSRAWFSYELSHEATVDLSIYDMHGDPVGGRRLVLGAKAEPGSGVEPGLNRIPLQSILYDDNLAPGVYVYRMEIFSGSASVNVKTGKFAVVR